MTLPSVRALLDSVIDYAGLFPPAQLPMQAAAHNYATYLAGEHAWMLGRFVLPAARIEELAHPDWPLSILGPTSVPLPTSNAAFRLQTTIELKAESPDDIEKSAGALPRDVTAYFELPIAADPKPLIQTLAQLGARAKVRTGGVTPAAFPTSGDLARFILRCHEHDVPFKATAGLHHPIRGSHPLTYEAGSPCHTMFGFLNVFLAAAFGRRGASIHAILEEESVAAFSFQPDGIGWRDYFLTMADITSARQNFAISFGSCSFEEPIRDLQAIRLL
ncbi:MAG TPA: hypothetical protein VKU01_22070 [Bryobacteraceae bacterium]|nr:hypothetical protein [Bryobacteraceae bacterium]